MKLAQGAKIKAELVGQTIEGYFQAFGIDFAELRDGVGNYTTAIILDDAGKFHSIAIERCELAEQNT